MIEQLSVRNHQGSILDLPLGDALSGLIVEGVEGLDPVKATLVASSFANQDGQQYQSGRRETRNIRISIALVPDYATQSVRQLRQTLYEFFMPKTEVHLKFLLENGLPLEISGRVETLETELFSAEPTATISIICFNPDFYDARIIEKFGFTTSTGTQSTIEYAGTIETGISFQLRPTRSVPEFSIYHQPPDGSLRIFEFVAPLVSDDILNINTTRGEKSARVVRGGSEISILYGVSPQSNWIELLPGANKFRVYAPGGGVAYTLKYTNKYGGL